jgi:glycosyltransferase 2 family protein
MAMTPLPRWLSLPLRLLPAALLVVVFLRERGSSTLWKQPWPQVSALALLAMVAINFAVFLPTRTWRWRAALPAPPSFATLYASLLEGLLASIALGFGSGDVVRAARLRGAGGFSASYGATIAERGAELVAMALLLLLGVAVAGLGWPGLVAAAVILVAYVLTLTFGRRLAPRLARWPRLVNALEAGLAASRPRRVAAMVAFSLAGWLSELGIIMIGLHAFALPWSAGTALMALLGIQVAIALPGPPANVGTFEAGVVAGLRLCGVPVEQALLFGLFYHLVMTVPVALAGTAVFLFRGYSRSGGRSRATFSTKNERANG